DDYAGTKVSVLLNSTSGSFTGQVYTIVVQSGSTTTLSSSSNPSTFGQSVTFSATVSGSGSTPTGTVTFVDTSTGVTLGTPTLAGGSTSVTTTALQLVTASDVITAIYNG